jgi:hypothetical protein
MQKGDNLPVGILLCINKRKKLVEYATAGIDNILCLNTCYNCHKRKNYNNLFYPEFSENNQPTYQPV